MRPAERRHGGQITASSDFLADLDPLIRPFNVMGVLACSKQLTEDLLDHSEIIDVASGHRRQGLVEQQHALINPIVVNQARAKVCQRRELE